MKNIGVCGPRGDEQAKKLPFMDLYIYHQTKNEKKYVFGLLREQPHSYPGGTMFSMMPSISTFLARFTNERTLRAQVEERNEHIQYLQEQLRDCRDEVQRLREQDRDRRAEAASGNTVQRIQEPRFDGNALSFLVPGLLSYVPQYAFVIARVSRSWRAEVTVPLRSREEFYYAGGAGLTEWACNNGLAKLKVGYDNIIVAVRMGALGALKALGPFYRPWEHMQACCVVAAQEGHMHILKWLHSQGCPIEGESVCEAAALRGHLEIIQWVRTELSWSSWGIDTCANAAKGGHLRTLQWVRAVGCPWDKETCDAAAEGGHLETLMWAADNGCPWDWSTCRAAARGSQLEILQWAATNGCPWDESVTREARRRLGWPEVDKRGVGLGGRK